MNIKIHCPGCQAQLRVPVDSSGRRARCPKCSKKFIIPNPSELFEETVSTWIERDVEDVRRTGGPGDDKSSASPAMDQTILGEAVDSASTVLSGSELPADKSAKAPSPKAAAVMPKPAGTKRPAASSAPAPHSGASEAPKGARPERDYPTQLQPPSNRPYLVVQSCDQDGVRFTFDSVWLENDAFRASFPMRCLMSDVEATDQLVARPLAFTDQAGSQARSASQIERGHEHRLQPNQSTRDVMRAMGDLAGLPKPFNQAMPYFVSHGMSGRSIKCATHAREGGGITCEVVIPHAAAALQWLGRVNGICGPEYELLNHDIHSVGGDGWRAVSEKCRQRLNVWCHFATGEIFRLYLNDADFAASDAGLAGLVVTDRRLIFHKYHHSGEVALDANAVLRIRLEDAEFATLVLEHERDRTRVAKLHRHDLAKLSDAIHNAPGLRIETANLVEEESPAG